MSAIGEARGHLKAANHLWSKASKEKDPHKKAELEGQARDADDEAHFAWQEARFECREEDDDGSQ